MSTLKIEHISHLDNGTPDLSIDSSGHLNIVNGNLQMGGVTMLNTSTGAPLPLAGGAMTGVISNFESTGIDDQATSNVLTILSNGSVGIGATGSARFTLSGTASANDLSSAMVFALGASTKLYLGASNATDNIITGSSLGDTVLRSNGDNILFSVDSGASSAVYIKSDGNVGIGISPTHLLHVQAGSTGNGDVKIGGGAGLLISHNNSGATVQTIKSLYHATSASSNLRIVTGFLTVSTGTSDTERLRLTSNGSFEIGYAGAALQQANSQAMTITTPASGGGQGIAIKRLDSNSDQQLGAITFSNNTQDGLGGMVMKTDGAVNSTELKFSTTTGGTSTDQLRIRHNGKVQFTQRETLMAGVEIRHAVFGTHNYNRRVEVQLDNYESCYVRFMAQRTNGGSCFIYWEGYINNNNNGGYSSVVAERLSNGTVSASFSVSGGYFRWDIAAAGSSGDGTIYLMGCRGGPTINITTF